jgi:hypothetical protein
MYATVIVDLRRELDCGERDVRFFHQRMLCYHFNADNRPSKCCILLRQKMQQDSQTNQSHSLTTPIANHYQSPNSSKF